MTLLDGVLIVAAFVLILIGARQVGDLLLQLGAAVIEAVPGDGSLLGWDLGADGSLQSILYADHGSGMRMQGKEVFRRAVRAVVDAVDDSDLFLSVLSIGELAKGIALVKDNAQKRKLASWLQELESEYADRLLADMVPLEGQWPDPVLAQGEASR